MALIYPSLISADILNLETQIKTLDPYCPGYHLDVMDNHFVPNLTWGPSFIEAISSKTTRQLWVHLMVDNPTVWIEKLSLPPKTIASFHIETINDTSSIINLIQKKNWLTSIAISPKTPVAKLLPYAKLIDQVLVMSVNPGFSGQQFMEDSKAKVQALADYRTKNGLNFKIAMDGGISADNIQELTALGVDHFAVAHAIFGQPDPVTALQELEQLAK